MCRIPDLPGSTPSASGWDSGGRSCCWHCLTAWATTHTARRLEQAVEPGFLARARADVERHPSRVLANALVNVA